MPITCIITDSYVHAVSKQLVMITIDYASLAVHSSIIIYTAYAANNGTCSRRALSFETVCHSEHNQLVIILIWNIAANIKEQKTSQPKKIKIIATVLSYFSESVNSFK